MKSILALLLLFSSPPLQANFVAALLRGTKAAATITYKIVDTDPIGANGRIARHMAAVVERLDLPTNVSPEGFTEALRSLDVDARDSHIHEMVLAALELDSVGGPQDWDALLDDISRLAHRYAPSRRWHRLFPYTTYFAPLSAAQNTREFATLRHLADPSVGEIARMIPRRHGELIHILREEMPSVFPLPHSRYLDKISPERMALAVLLIRLAHYGDGPVHRWARALLELMASGQHKDFFDPSNDPSHYMRLLFDEEGFYLDIEGQTEAFQQAAALRRQNKALSLKAAIRFQHLSH